jgi:methylamine utilization protein MauE
MPYLILTCDALIALVFTVSAGQKLRGRAAFDRHARATLTMLDAVVPGRRPGRVALRRLAAVLIAAELAVPVLIVSVWPARVGQALAVLLLVAFSTGILASLARGLRVPCSCFGSSDTPLGPAHLARNGLLLVAAIVGVVNGTGPVAKAAVSGTVITIVAASAAAALLIRLDDLLALFRLSSSPELERKET